MFGCFLEWYLLISLCESNETEKAGNGALLKKFYETSLMWPCSRRQLPCQSQKTHFMGLIPAGSTNQIPGSTNQNYGWRAKLPNVNGQHVAKCALRRATRLGLVWLLLCCKQQKHRAPTCTFGNMPLHLHLATSHVPLDFDQCIPGDRCTFAKCAERVWLYVHRGALRLFIFQQGSNQPNLT